MAYGSVNLPEILLAVLVAHHKLVAGRWTNGARKSTTCFRISALNAWAWFHGAFSSLSLLKSMNNTEFCYDGEKMYI